MYGYTCVYVSYIRQPLPASNLNYDTEHKLSFILAIQMCRENVKCLLPFSTL